MKPKTPRYVQQRNNSLLRLISTSNFPGKKKFQHFLTFHSAACNPAIFVMLTLFLFCQTDIIMTDAVETYRENQSRALWLKTMPEEEISLI